MDEIIYGNEKDEHKNLYFILNGEISFVRLQGIIYSIY